MSHFLIWWRLISVDLAEQIYTTGSSSSLFPKIGLHRCYFMTFSDIFEKKKFSKLRHSKTVVRRYFTKNEFLKIVKNSQENSFARVSSSKQSWRLQACNFIKKEIRRRYFPVNFTKFSRTLFSSETNGQQLYAFLLLNTKREKGRNIAKE